MDSLPSNTRNSSTVKAPAPTQKTDLVLIPTKTIRAQAFPLKSGNGLKKAVS